VILSHRKTGGKTGQRTRACLPASHYPACPGKIFCFFCQTGSFSRRFIQTCTTPPLAMESLFSLLSFCDPSRFFFVSENGSNRLHLYLRSVSGRLIRRGPLTDLLGFFPLLFFLLTWTARSCGGRGHTDNPCRLDREKPKCPPVYRCVSLRDSSVGFDHPFLK